MKNKVEHFDKITQFLVPGLTISAQIAISLKYPKYGLIINLFAQPFWLYSSWKAYKEAGQTGLFVTAVAWTLITLGGVINYWFL